MSSTPRIRILVIDDSEYERIILSDLLSAHGHEVIIAASGPEGLRAAHAHTPDLILLDVMMPEMDGFEVCERLRAAPEIADAPIIMITTLDDRQSRLRGLQAGADEFLSKPLDMIELRTRVQTIARLNRYRRLLDERQRAVRALTMARDAALDASRVKSEFLAVISHELLTPLNGIIGMADLLAMMVSDNDQRDCVRMLQESGANLHMTLRNLLDYASLEAGKVSCYEGVFSIAQAIQRPVAAQSLQAQSKGLRLWTELADGLPAAVYGDSDLLQRVLSELIANAIKFTARGAIVVSAEPIATAGEQAIIAIQVRDSGIGIDPDVQPRLFKPFSQADSSTTRHARGMGMGLAIARLRAELLGGALSVASAPGQGSTFTLRASLRVAE